MKIKISGTMDYLRELVTKYGDARVVDVIKMESKLKG